VRDGRIIPLDRNGALPLGILVDQDYSQATVALEPDDLLLLYTDGITEAVSPAKDGGSRQLFGVERLDALLLDCRGTSAPGCVERVCREVANFTADAPPTDDQTLIAIRANPAGGG
jgi:sigma-B regulation protein RsbU (phosphoserine phosphatase)